jgi:hypothetical protein
MEVIFWRWDPRSSERRGNFVRDVVIGPCQMGMPLMDTTELSEDRTAVSI